MAEFKDYFIYTKFCVCKKDLKNFKIFLYYNECGTYVFLRMKKKANFHFRVRSVIRYIN